MQQPSMRAFKRRQRSKNGERRQRTLVQMDLKTNLVALELAKALGLSKTEVLNFAIMTLAESAQQAATDAEVTAANQNTEA